MASRDPEDLTEGARGAWEQSQIDYRDRYPNGPRPFLTCTWRSGEEQDQLYAMGRTEPGKVVTNARAGQSNHNKRPSPAMDIAFKDSMGAVLWDVKLYKQFAELAKLNGLSWGGDWKKFKDYPHFEIAQEVA